MSEEKSDSMFGKKIIITGASSGIGRAAAKLLMQHGAKVVAVGRNKDALDELKKEIGCFTVVGDLTDTGVPKKVVQESVKLMGGLTTR